MPADPPFDPPFAGVKACVFDAYGTLFDVHSAVARYEGQLGGNGAELSALWRQKQLEYTWLRSLMGRHADFRQITSDALDYAFARYGFDDKSLAEELLLAYDRLDAYEDAAACLQALAAKGLTRAILSNGTPQMLESALHSAGLAEHLEAVISIEEVGIYKPDPRVYDLVCRRFALEPREVAFLSANAWDAAGAAAFGYQVAWINRRCEPVEVLPGRPLARVATLTEFADLVLEATESNP
jgi:2-haloacid dehalogenase